jgi:hypothetical protein
VADPAAGVLGIIGVVLGIGVYLAPGGQTMDVGAWMYLAGSVLALIGGSSACRSARGDDPGSRRRRSPRRPRPPPPR